METIIRMVNEINLKNKTVAIVGGGITGLAIGYYLTKQGFKVKIIEKNKEIGGLIRTVDIFGTPLEEYYHHFFLSDKELNLLLTELKLDHLVIKKETKMGVYYNNQILPFSTPLDLLRFSPLSLSDRIKQGMMVLYFKYKKNWKKLETISSKEWLIKNTGEFGYKVLWEPLLKTKFGQYYEDIPASWLWGRIHPRSKSREGGKEKLHYIKGSFKVLSQRLLEEVCSKGGELVLKEIKSISTTNKEIEYTDSEKETFDSIVLTLPNPVIQKMFNNIKELDYLSPIKYQAIICAILQLKEPLSDYYWINNADPEIKFGGVIEHTNFIDKENYNRRSMVYLFNYIDSADIFYTASEEEIKKRYLQDLKKIFPSFSLKNLESFHLSRGNYATPVYNGKYSQKIPPFNTPFSGIFIANTSQIYPEDRNVSNSIALAKKLVTKIVANS